MRVYHKRHPVHGLCLYADNGYIEIGIPFSFGIRITHFGLSGKENMFYEDPIEDPKFSTPDGWRLRGGYRIWPAPEGPWDYVPDNLPVDMSINEDDDLIVLSEQPCSATGFRKRMEIKLLDRGIRVRGSLENITDHDISCSVWIVSTVAPGGVEEIPLPFSGNDSPRVSLCYWDHTDPGDPRFRYEKDRIVISHMKIPEHLKIGISRPAGPVRYTLGDVTLVKSYDFTEDAVYTDRGSSYETYFSEHMAELESLSPVYTIKPGCEISHTEELLIEENRG